MIPDNSLALEWPFAKRLLFGSKEWRGGRLEAPSDVPPSEFFRPKMSSHMFG